MGVAGMDDFKRVMWHMDACCKFTFCWPLKNVETSLDSLHQSGALERDLSFIVHNFIFTARMGSIHLVYVSSHRLSPRSRL